VHLPLNPRIHRHTSINRAPEPIAPPAHATAQAAGRIVALRALCAALRDALDTLGLSDSGAPSAELATLCAAALSRAAATEAELAAAIEARRDARASGDYAAGDAIRDALAARGIALMDGAADGRTVWRPSVPTQA
jgi:cysteinyl-tRNA synthetase